MIPATILAVLSVAGAVSAQTGSATQHYKSSLDMTIDPNSVDAQTRAGWCNAQTNTCNTLCGDSTNKNDCSGTDLSWACTCSSNNTAPGLQYYTQTMPDFICEELFGQCNAQNTGSSKGQDACKSNIKDLCATQNPPKKPVDSGDDSSSSSSSAASSTMATKTGSSSQSTASSASSAPTSSSSGFAAPTLAPVANGFGAAAAIGVLAYLL